MNDPRHIKHQFLLEACKYLFGQNAAFAPIDCPAMVSGMVRLDAAKKDGGGEHRRPA